MFIRMVRRVADRQCTPCGHVRRMNSAAGKGPQRNRQLRWPHVHVGTYSPLQASAVAIQPEQVQCIPFAWKTRTAEVKRCLLQAAHLPPTVASTGVGLCTLALDRHWVCSICLKVCSISLDGIGMIGSLGSAWTPSAVLCYEVGCVRTPSSRKTPTAWSNRSLKSEAARLRFGERHFSPPR
jgi:hypothetical protein